MPDVFIRMRWDTKKKKIYYLDFFCQHFIATFANLLDTFLESEYNTCMIQSLLSNFEGIKRMAQNKPTAATNPTRYKF